jgi:hypothetical protein
MFKRVYLFYFLLITNGVLLGQSDCNNAVSYGAVGSASLSANLTQNNFYWFSFTTDGSHGKIEISTCGSSFDTNIDLFATCSSSGPMVSNDNACGKQSVINYNNLTSGTYFVKISGKNNESGSILFSVKTPTSPDPPALVSATAFDDTVALSWSNVINATQYGIYQVVDSNSGMTCEEQGLKADCDGNCFSMEVSGAWIGDGYCDDGSFGVNFNCSLYEFDGGDCASGQVADPSLIEKPMAFKLSKVSESKSYVSRGVAQDTSKFLSRFYPEKDLSFVVTSFNSIGESAYSAEAKVKTAPPYAGQVCEISIEISDGTYETNGKKQFYTYTAPFDAKVKVSSNNAESSATWDTDLWIFSDCSLDSVVAANDECCAQPGPSEVVFQADSGATYIVLWENSHNPGVFTFSVSTTQLFEAVKPTNLTAVSDLNSIMLHWDDQATANAYNVFMINSGDSAIFYNKFYYNSAIIKNLEYETKYTFAVSAIGYNGESDLSEKISIYTDDTPPPPYYNPLIPLSGPIDPMYFFIDSARYDGKHIGRGWEVGVFDDTLVVGSLLINDKMPNGFSIITTADDTNTVAHDGFRSDSAITFQFYNHVFLQEGVATAEFSTSNYSIYKRNGSTKLRLEMEKFGARDCAFDIPSNWTIDPSQFNYSMNITAELYDGDMALNDTLYTLAAFINGEVRGLSRVNYISELDAYQVRISILSNNTSSETIRFQIFNGVSCILQPVVKETIPFAAGTFSGSAGAPIVLHATDDRLMELNLEKGNNEISFNVALDNMVPTNVLGDLGYQNGDQIKTLSGFSQFVDSIGWVGTLDSLKIATMYMLDTQNSQKLMIAGKPINYKTTEISYALGWNWIGYLPNVSLPSSEALKDLQATPNSRILHKDGYLEYVDGVGWIGSVSEFKPGDGFLLFSENSGYFVFGKDSNLGKQGIQTDDRVLELQDSLALDKFGAMDPRSFRYNSTIIGELQFANGFSDNIYDMIAVYVGSELRGVSRTVYVEKKDKYLSFLQIYSNQIEGEELSFRTFNSYLNEMNFLDGTLPFTNNERMGTIDNPIIFSLSIVDPENVPKQYRLDQNYPNPFHKSTNIDYAIHKISQVKISVLNLKGQKVKTLIDQKEAPGFKSIFWDATNEQGKPMPSAVYIIVMEAQPSMKETNFEGFRKSMKILLLK